MSWVSVFAGFLVAHMVGDYLLQTDWQARHKRGGLTDPAARRPLVTHVTTYTLAFAGGCVASSIYGFLQGAWPFGVVEIAWTFVAVRRWQQRRVSRRTEP